jgi:sugar phosphate isomerase/epimerase
MNQPIGFQNFEIFPNLAKDWQGTWNTLGGYGYRFVDMLRFGPMAQRTPDQLKETFKQANLTADTCHFSHPDLTTSLTKTVAFAHQMSLKYLVCAPAGRVMGAKTLDDWKWMADQLNQIGASIRAEGLTVGYHNHEIEFRQIDGQYPYDVLMASTNPQLVKFQIDVGNLTFAGADAAMFLAKYPLRYFSMHCKDFKLGKASVSVGAGDLDWSKLFALAAKAKIMNYVAEVGAYSASTVGAVTLEPSEIDIMESCRRSFLFLRDFKPSA